MTATDGAGPALSVTIPGVPPRDLSPNARGVSGWRRSRLVADERELVARHVRDQLGPDPAAPAGPLVLDATIAWPSGRRRMDDDGAWGSLKAHRDQLAASLGLPSDRAIRQGALAQVRAERGDRAGWVELTIRPAVGE